MKVIITGSTGMVGKAVLLECLDNRDVESILVINRESIEIKHPKLKEIIHKEFFDLSPIENEIRGYDACFFCLGVSSAGMKEAEYTKITYDLTKHFSDIFIEQNPQSKFVYISAAGADSSQKGRIMWARVRGKTESMILNKGFMDAYSFRPGAILPTKGVKSKTKWVNVFYNLLKPFNSLLLKSKHVSTSSKVGLAMINIVQVPQEKKILENIDINKASEK